LQWEHGTAAVAPRCEQMHRFRTRTQPILAVAFCAASLLSACGDDAGALPDGCGDGDQILRSLRSAPGSVRLGDARLSDCFQKNASGDELQLVGASFVDAASRLSTRARRHPDGRAALELGYLEAAAHRGGSRTQGIHDELLRRLDQELGAVNTRTRAYRRGKRAGAAAG
jgi:hypothetical protein